MMKKRSVSVSFLFLLCSLIFWIIPARAEEPEIILEDMAAEAEPTLQISEVPGETFEESEEMIIEETLNDTLASADEEKDDQSGEPGEIFLEDMAEVSAPALAAENRTNDSLIETVVVNPELEGLISEDDLYFPPVDGPTAIVEDDVQILTSIEKAAAELKEQMKERRYPITITIRLLKEDCPENMARTILDAALADTGGAPDEGMYLRQWSGYKLITSRAADKEGYINYKIT